MLACIVNAVQGFEIIFIFIILRILFEHLGQADHGVQWSSQFMTHVGEKLAFGLVGVLCFLPCFQKIIVA